MLCPVTAFLVGLKTSLADPAAPYQRSSARSQILKGLIKDDVPVEQLFHDRLPLGELDGR